MPVVLFYSDNNDAPGDWEKALGAHVADLDFRAGADRIGDPAEI
ncbi:MAG: glyoxylate/hydroxypyruvate reductase A, partial [Nisaea sp.]|nr:glyoxylate/hydroxypyruvate reductase A [Nisaea sp.]